jgi:hypothetical protein
VLAENLGGDRASRAGVPKSLPTYVVAALLGFAPAAAAKDRVGAVVLHSVTPVAECPTCPPLHRPESDAERDLATLARQLDGVVVDAAQDLGLSVDVSSGPQTVEGTTDRALVEQATTDWVFSPRLALDRGLVVLRIVAVAPGSKVVFSRVETTKPNELDVKVALMMRDLVGATARSAPPTPAEAARRPNGVVHAARSPGRAILALNAAVFGGYVGFSLQRATGSHDARLTYPLVALGAGIGLGSSMIVADEWDVGVGDAWYLAAGIWWPALGALLVADSYSESDKRYLYGAGAAASGLALATTSLSFGAMGEGGALITHSGGAFGTVLGGITQLAIDGETDSTPTRGMGIGAMSGVVLAGALARVYPHEAASRVILVDLSVGLGGLAGAAVGSPLVFGEDVGPTRNRLWLSGIALGMAGGAIVGLVLFPSTPPKPRADLSIYPTAGVIDIVRDPDGLSRPVNGVGVRGAW